MTHSAGSSDSCNPERQRIRWSVEIPRGNPAAHNYRQKACSLDPPDNSKNYTARWTRIKTKRAFVKKLRFIDVEFRLLKLRCSQERSNVATSRSNPLLTGSCFIN